MEVFVQYSILIFAISIIWNTSAAYVPALPTKNLERHFEIIFHQWFTESYLEEMSHIDGLHSEILKVKNTSKPFYPDFSLGRSLREIFAEFKSQYAIKNFIKLPDINRTLLNGKFLATGGYLRNFISIQMNERNIQVQKAAGYLAVSVPFKFKEFEAGYQKYSIEIAKQNQTGRVKITADSNEISVIFEWVHDPHTCALSIHEVVFENLQGIKVSVEGIYSDMVEVLSEWIVTNYEKQIRQLVATEMKQKFSLLSPHHCTL